ncbi:MAG: GNAT family N-acetyltransferase [Clostridia bacterium]|nr:GNAT family N-acetyltransferase [Clostridia bacterium]
MLTFVPPSEVHRTDVLGYTAEVTAYDGEFDGSAGLGAFDSYTLWLERIRLLASEQAQKHGFYRTLVYLAYDGEQLTGIVSVRLTDDDFVTTYAGHIGYHIRPSCRRMGYGKQLLSHAVTLCRSHGIPSPVVCTDPGNTASRRTALSCGFDFAGEADFRGERKILRYVLK